MASSENELPGLTTTEESAQSSSGNMTDSDTQEHKNNNNNFAFMDQAFFYNLDQLAPDNPLFFMQQQHGFDNQFLTKDNENRSVTTSLANSLESLRSAVAANTTEGEQPLSFWSGLNNFLSNVTHNNLFPAIPNIARSFSEYLANHPVPFLSSL
ncbi:hypothetical protein K501DRAFT_196907 [Backusella circina FSU 941]|nr:hypothetical protein K501DRAFT_196907 [Backusella circina FSU 941]